MKKLLLLAIMAVATIAASAETESVSFKEKFDLNGDTQVDVGDVNLLLDYILAPAAYEDDHQPTGVVKTYTVGGVSFKMVSVGGGTFTMGATAEQGTKYPQSYEYPIHEVTLSHFWIGQTEVTEALWRAVMGSNPSNKVLGGNYPVDNVTWEDCQTFIGKLNELTGENFRLPTEAEWEFAARGGTLSKGYMFSGSDTASDVAWYAYRSSKCAVATKAANELGLYDMSGNLSEWCSDWYYYAYYSYSPINNPVGPPSGENRVTRGGNWGSSLAYCRVSSRSSNSPTYSSSYLGLRLAR